MFQNFSSGCGSTGYFVFVCSSRKPPNKKLKTNFANKPGNLHTNPQTDPNLSCLSWMYINFWKLLARWINSHFWKTDRNFVLIFGVFHIKLTVTSTDKLKYSKIRLIMWLKKNVHMIPNQINRIFIQRFINARWNGVVT